MGNGNSCSSMLIHLSSSNDRARFGGGRHAGINQNPDVAALIRPTLAAEFYRQTAAYQEAIISANDQN
jgi:hypothetical protein